MPFWRWGPFDWIWSGWARWRRGRDRRGGLAVRATLARIESVRLDSVCVGSRRVVVDAGKGTEVCWATYA